MWLSLKLSAQKVETWCAESLNDNRIYFSRLCKVFIIKWLGRPHFPPFLPSFLTFSGDDGDKIKG